jgi:hypothetical protein
MILPAPGNHDLETQGGKPYFEFFKATFEALKADKALATYATGLPTSAGTDAPWLLVALNSNKSPGASGGQVTWLKDVLTKATKAKCVLAAFDESFSPNKLTKPHCGAFVGEIMSRLRKDGQQVDHAGAMVALQQPEGYPVACGPVSIKALNSLRCVLVRLLGRPGGRW